MATYNAGICCGGAHDGAISNDGGVARFRATSSGNAHLAHRLEQQIGALLGSTAGRRAEAPSGAAPATVERRPNYQATAPPPEPSSMAPTHAYSVSARVARQAVAVSRVKKMKSVGGGVWPCCLRLLAICAR